MRSICCRDGVTPQKTACSTCAMGRSNAGLGESKANNKVSNHAISFAIGGIRATKLSEPTLPSVCSCPLIPYANGFWTAPVASGQG